MICDAHSLFSKPYVFDWNVNLYINCQNHIIVDNSGFVLCIILHFTPFPNFVYQFKPFRIVPVLRTGFESPVRITKVGLWYFLSKIYGGELILPHTFCFVSLLSSFPWIWVDVAICCVICWLRKMNRIQGSNSKAYSIVSISADITHRQKQEPVTAL